ncbi:M48 family metalloprotease [Thalassotalea aquiviva]|uniref:M48 family metalloprotease n=1 Tax=Thalassotalea aquiviva TaxID=3242415 RepID=UPI00352BA14D
MTINKFLSLLLVIVTISFTTSCALNPATGTPDFVFMSESEEVSKGKELHQQILNTTPIYDDPKLTAYINEIGQKIVKNSHRPDIEYHFTIIDSPDINAFALPGGYIYINRGILAYLDSEAQLAAILAHEIAHVTARHVVRQDAARKGAGALTVATVITTGSATLSDMSSLWGSAAVQGYGREMELEADGFGAEYLYKSGYSPMAMVETIGVLKDQEKFNRYRAKEEGRKIKSYHGVFSTHPRNDKRLREVIAKAGELPPGEANNENVDIYREKTQGMIFGVNYQARLKNEQLEKDRFYHGKLGFSIKFPPNWQVNNTRSAIISADEKNTAQMELKVSRVQNGVAPDAYLRTITNNQLLSKAQGFQQNGLLVYTGVLASESTPQRVAMIYQGSRAYFLAGTVHQPQNDVDYDSMFLQSIKSFRPEKPMNLSKKSKRIHYVKANQNTTIAALAQHIQLGPYTEQYLRLINGLYPRKEPEPGDWIKIVE